ncbi:uncharacterized protein LOC118746480 [Rhagoletis pomonella]|uniref:uncharacterized protein LOC118746480 n=1 Tax=Rhagoletis pomonella TaxID=28610 RepID=UPI0017860510|nr:uncharacterized protein LOC118746480 [Rhagoletis pomonella]
MEQRGAYLQAQQQPANYGAIDRPYGEAVPPNFTPAQVAVHVEATSVPVNNPQPAGQDVPPADSWFARSRRNEPQTNSAGSATLVLISGGMNLAWSCGFSAVQGFMVNTHLMICWYIAVIIGALVSGSITHRMERKPIYLFSSFLILVGGILFVSLPHEYGAIAAARYLNGFAVGLVVVPTLVLIGEEVESSERGKAAALLEMGSFTIGIFLQICCIFAYSNSDTIPSFQYKFGSTELHGIFVIAFAVITFLLSYFLVIESPVYYLLHNDENKAIDCLRRLQRPFVVTQETYQQLEEHKRYIQDNSFNSDLMLPALLKMCLYRGLVSLSFSPLIILALLLSTLSYAGDDTRPYILFGVFLWHV